MGIDNRVEDNAVYFKNLTLVTERLLCFKLESKVYYTKYMLVVYSWILFYKIILIFRKDFKIASIIIKKKYLY
jgi:hypothetical protein